MATPETSRAPNRRALLKGLGAAGLGAGLAGLSGVGANRLYAQPVRKATEAIQTKPIPASGENIPVIGMGTWITFNVGDDAALRDQRTQILETFFSHGGGMIDCSPMYGTSADVLGYGLEKLGYPASLFAASKVWTAGWQDGEEQMAEQRARWGVDRFDLMQIHNLVDWEAHLETLKDDKAEGRIRYLGLTTSHGRRHGELERIMEREELDFVQLTYNMADREAEARLLPLARERGIAVIANRPFRHRQLIETYQGRPPTWAAEEAGARNWPEFFLKFIVSHPAVTCAIPATSQLDHMRENMGAGLGHVPNEKTRARMSAYLESL